MSDKWFEAYTYQAVVHKKYFSERSFKSAGKRTGGIKALGPYGISGVMKKAVRRRIAFLLLFILETSVYFTK